MAITLKARKFIFMSFAALAVTAGFAAASTPSHATTYVNGPVATSPGVSLSAAAPVANPNAPIGVGNALPVPFPPLGARNGTGSDGPYGKVGGAGGGGAGGAGGGGGK